ncbi:MAG: SRPBCC domain-containing protein [Candidatus Sulfotelmatobacter sp.]
MAIKFSGEFEVKQQPEEVYDFLTDPSKFAPLLPEFQGVAVLDATHFTVKVNVGISYIKGTADVKMELAESDRPRRARYKGQGAVAGGNVTMVASFDLAPRRASELISNPMPDPASDVAPEAALNLAPNNGGTKVNWQGEAQIFGRLTSVAGGLLEPLGKKQIQKLIDGLQAALA